MRYLVKIGELKEKIDYLEKQLSIIDKNIEVLRTIKSSIKWEGEASLSFERNFNSYLKELNMIENYILANIRYLIKYYDVYGTEYTRLRRKYANTNMEV